MREIIYEDLICKVCSSHHFIRLTDTEYQCECCGFTLCVNETCTAEKTSLINAHNTLEMGDYIEAEDMFTNIYNKNGKCYEALWGKIISHYGISYIGEYPQTKKDENVTILNLIDNTNYYLGSEG